MGQVDTDVNRPPAGSSGSTADRDAAAALSAEVVRLTRAGNALRAQLASRPAGGVEWSTYLLLFHLVREGPQRASTLAEAVHVDPSTVSRQVAQLVRLGLVERRADPGDGRACLLVPTAAGEQLHADLRQRRERAFVAMVADWPAQDVRRLADLLARLNSAVEANRQQLLDALADTGDRTPGCTP